MRVQRGQEGRTDRPGAGVVRTHETRDASVLPGPNVYASAVNACYQGSGIRTQGSEVYMSTGHGVGVREGGEAYLLCLVSVRVFLELFNREAELGARA